MGYAADYEDEFFSAWLFLGSRCLRNLRQLESSITLCLMNREYKQFVNTAEDEREGGLRDRQAWSFILSLTDSDSVRRLIALLFNHSQFGCWLFAWCTVQLAPFFFFSPPSAWRFMNHQLWCDVSLCHNHVRVCAQALVIWAAEWGERERTQGRYKWSILTTCLVVAWATFPWSNWSDALFVACPCY